MTGPTQPDDAQIALFRTTRTWLLWCGVAVGGSSMICCSGSVFWMIPKAFTLNWSDGPEMIIWAGLYGWLGLMGFLVSALAISQSRSIALVLDSGQPPEQVAWAKAYVRTTWFFMVGGMMLASIAVLGGMAAMLSL